MFQNMQAGRVAIFMLTQCTFWQQILSEGRPMLKRAAVLSHTWKENNLALDYCHLEVERFPTSSRRRFLDAILKHISRVCLCLSSDSQGSALQSGCCSILWSKKHWCEQREGTGGACWVCQAGLGWAETSHEVSPAHWINVQSHMPEQCSRPPLHAPLPCPGFSLCVSPSEQCFVSLQLTVATF